MTQPRYAARARQFAERDNRRSEAVMTEDSGAVTETVPCDLVRKATEALAKDVGRGLARLDPADMSLTGIAPGDVIRLTGKRATVAKAMPAFPKDRGKGVVQIDGVTRHNAGTSLGERLRLQRTDYRPAKKVRLAPLTAPRYARKENQELCRPSPRGPGIGRGRSCPRDADGHAQSGFHRSANLAQGTGGHPADDYDRGQPPRRRHRGTATEDRLRGYRRAAARARFHPRDDRAAAALSGNFRTTRHLGAERRPPARPPGMRQNAHRPGRRQ